MHAPVYRLREPEHTVLWQCVREHLPAFVARTAEANRALPDFVRKEFEGFLACGILERGFARIRCLGCGFERLVAFSCKGRGVCPSCVARRMSDTAAHLVDRVFPSEVPMRQWVLSVPMPLRYLLAWDTQLLSRIVRIFVAAVARHLRRTALRELGVLRTKDAHVGAVCMVQRWGGSANLNVHLHGLCTDGVFVREADGALRFRELPEPTRGEIAAIAWEVCQRVVALLRKRGQWLDAPPEADALAEREALLSELYAASLSGTLLFNRGQRQVRLFGAAAREARDKPKNAYGFDVDASVRVPAHDREGLERLARYMLRPVLGKSRLTRQVDGRYRIRLRKAWRDGTTDIVLDGVELVGRLAALVPQPRVHLTKYFGLFAPRHALRREVVPQPADAHAACEHAVHTRGRPERRLSWSKLLARVFRVDVLECPRCKSRLQRIEWCTSPERIDAVLRSRGPPADLDPVA